MKLLLGAYATFTSLAMCLYQLKSDRLGFYLDARHPTLPIPVRSALKIAN